MDRKQAIAVVIMCALILAGMAGLYYGLWVIYQAYQTNVANNPLVKLFGG